jgi:hypothetical protein
LVCKLVRVTLRRINFKPSIFLLYTTIYPWHNNEHEMVFVKSQIVFKKWQSCLFTCWKQCCPLLVSWLVLSLVFKTQIGNYWGFTNCFKNWYGDSWGNEYPLQGFIQWLLRSTWLFSISICCWCSWEKIKFINAHNVMRHMRWKQTKNIIRSGLVVGLTFKINHWMPH